MMKLALNTLLLLVSGPSLCAAFAPEFWSARTCSSLKATPNDGSTRAAFLKQVCAGGLATLTFLPQSANAAKYGGFGAGSPEVLDPKEAIVDADILASEAVQRSLSNMKNYVGIIDSIRSTLASDSQAEFGPVIRRDLDFVKLRTDLNTIGTAFDEDTQRGIDRLIRVILQDVTELEVSSKIKPGIPRSERRVGNINAKLDKLSAAFSDYLAFAS